jgi:molybdopterin molybdotransferase
LQARGDLISVDEACARVLATVRTLAAERVPAAEALGRVLAEDVISQFALPPFDSSAMDGFALVAGPPGELPVIGESQAGRPWHGHLERGEAVRISTGAVIPPGADAVVPVERVQIVGHDGDDPAVLPPRIKVDEVRRGANVRHAGDDVHAGELVIPLGSEVGPAEVGMLAALGEGTAVCARRPRVAIAATGDELRPAGAELGPGQIHDSNAAAIAALAVSAGATVAQTAWIADDEQETSAALERLAEDADVLCVSGGVSVGPHDHVRPALGGLGFDQRIWGVRLKPGKPVWFGVRDRGGERQYAFGLPGNPVSAMVTFQLFARPALRKLQGADPSATRSTAILDGPIEANSERDQAVRCRLRMADDGWHAEPTGPQGSHVMSSMLGADALAVVPAGERGLAPGERVGIELL